MTDIIQKVRQMPGTLRIKHPLYRSWEAMKRRCDNKSDKSFKHYGARGISYCAEWTAFDGFLNDMGGAWYDGAQIERIDVNGNYEPANCKWADRIEQANNKQNTELIEFNGMMKTLKRHCEDSGVSYKRVWARIHQYGMSISDAITNSVSDIAPRKGASTISKARVNEYNGKQYTLPELAAISGIGKSTLHFRIKRLGWDVKRAVETPLIR